MYKRNAPSRLAAKAVKKPQKGNSKKLNAGTYVTKPVARVELKARVDAASGTAPLVGQPLSLGRVPLGDTSYDRTGRAVLHQYQDIYLRLLKTTSDLSATVRIVYGVWKQALATSGVSPSITEVLDTTLFSGNAVVAPINSKYSQNLTILWDQLVDLNAGSELPSAQAAPVYWSVKRRFKYSAVQEYINTDGDDVSNWLHFMLIVPNTANIQYSVGVQSYFTDA